MSPGEHVLKAETVSALDEHLRGILHEHEGRYEDAIEAFNRATELDPGMAGSYVELGMAHACTGEHGRMVEALRRAVDVGAGAVRSYLRERPLGDLPAELTAVVSAMSLMAAGRDDEAVRTLELSPVQNSRRSPASVALLALSYMLRGEGVEADEEGVRRVSGDTGA